MAYASLLSLTQTLEEFEIILLHPHDLVHSQTTEQQMIMTSLHEKAKFLLSVLDVSSLPPETSDRIRGFEGRIREAACEAEDIIQSQQVSYGRNQILPEPGVDEDESHVSNDQIVEHNYCQGLQKLKDELASISEDLLQMLKERSELQLLECWSNYLPASSSRSARSPKKKVVVGMERDCKEIIHLLTKEHPELQVIPILGMPGIGKTTLAGLVYNHPSIAAYFDVRAWATVSQEYQEQKVLRDLLSSMRELNQESGQESIAKLAENITKSLKDKRYLIVLDDVWENEAWNRLKSLFPRNNNGSRIILTTRFSDVADKTDLRGLIHHISLRPDEECWSLLNRIVVDKEHMPFELVNVGKIIAMACRGLPLAVVMVSGLLSKAEMKLDYWYYLAENLRAVLITGAESWVLNLLHFIYNQLPHHLKACLLYMGILPEDYAIRRSKLTRLWVANGFIKPDRVKTLEEVAEEYLNDLIDRNLIMVREYNLIGEIKSCSIHDAVRDFCMIKANEENFLQVVNRQLDHLPEVANNTRHVSIVTDLKDQIPRSAQNCNLPIHSVAFFSPTNPNDALYFISSFQLLRVLNAITVMFDKFPAEIVELVTLKYIALTFWLKHKIPESISKLRNLETLIVNPGKFRSIFNTAFLPPEIWKMPRLRHLLFVRSFVPCPTDELNRGNFVNLENLRTFGNVINFRCTKEVVEMMPNLKKLVITYEHDGRTEWSSYCFDNFVRLHKLEMLKCFFFGKSYMKCQDPPLVNFAFPQNLKRLTLSGCRISWENISVVGSLPHLEVLKLKFHAFEGPVWESKDGEFSQLKLLLLHMTDLEQWKADETHFPCLERLSLRYCYNLVEVPCGIVGNLNLQEIELCECSQSVMASAKVIQDERVELGDEEFKVVLKQGDDTGVSS